MYQSGTKVSKRKWFDIHGTLCVSICWWVSRERLVVGQAKSSTYYKKWLYINVKEKLRKIIVINKQVVEIYRLIRDSASLYWVGS